MLKDLDFHHQRKKHEKQLLDTGLDSLKAASKKAVHKAGKTWRNKIADAVSKSKGDKIVKQEPAEETLTLTLK